MESSRNYLALARRWRPQQFKDVLGQEHVTRTLANAIRLNRIGHAYLFTGSRGIGKTTLARILAKSVNCVEGLTPTPCDRCHSCLGIIAGNSLDVLEIDAASNRGIDQVRELRENVKFAPASSRFKVYIIDEVHMLTREAFNALLKTLEEPPPAVKFVFATTDPHKLPPTIVSRCQRFDLRRLTTKDLVDRLKAILEEEKREYEEDALRALAGFANGSMRDAESVLDQVLVYCEKKIGLKEVLELLGVVPEVVINDISDAILSGDQAGVLKLAEEVFEKGWDISQFVAALVKHFHDLLFISLAGDSAAPVDLPDSLLKPLLAKSRRFSRPQLTFIIDELLSLENAIKTVLSPRTAVELTLVKLARAPGRIYVEDLLRRLEALEKQAPAVETPSAAGLPAADAAPADPPSASLETVKKHWPDFLESLGNARPRLRTYLAEGTPVEFKDGCLTVCFDEGRQFHRDELESPAHSSFLETMLKNKLGFAAKLKFTIAPISQPCDPVVSPPFPQAKKKILKNHPLIEEALELFDATIVSIKE